MAVTKDAWRPFHSWVKSSCLEVCAGKVHEGLLGFGTSIVRAWVVSIVCEDEMDRRLRSAQASSAWGDGKVEGSQLYVTTVEPSAPLPRRHGFTVCSRRSRQDTVTKELRRKGGEASWRSQGSSSLMHSLFTEVSSYKPSCLSLSIESPDEFVLELVWIELRSSLTGFLRTLS